MEMYIPYPLIKAYIATHNLPPQKAKGYSINLLIYIT